MIDYPKYHKEIVNELLDGKFLLFSDPEKFQSLVENEGFYFDFFEKTYGYDLVLRNEFAYLMSDKTDESLSRNFTIFLCILCYELGRKSTDFKTRIETGIFSYEEVKSLLENQKNFQEVISEIGLDKLTTFLKTLAKRNIIDFVNKNDLDFRFTKAVTLFFEFALELAKQQSTQEVEIEKEK